jgi:hypothetical protein
VPVAIQLLRLPFAAIITACLSAAAVSPAFAAPAATTTTLAITASGAAATAVAAGTVVTLTATVKAGSIAVAHGQVNFCDATASSCTDVHLIGTAQLNSSGAAALKFVPAPGTHSFKAEFASTASDAASASAATALTVEIPTATTIAQNGSTGSYTLKSTVTASGATLAPTGTVSFLDTSNSNKSLGSATLGSSTAGFSWTTPQSPATTANPQSIVVADFNGDGILDIAIGTNGTPATNNVGSINILLGNGDGTFQAAKKFTGLPNNQAMIAAPFVNGGPLDILTVDNNAGGTNNAAVLTGDGKGGGTLGTPFSLGGVASVTAVAAGDFNRDGNQDFVITGVIYGVYCFAPVLGNGNGTFGSPTLNAVGSNPLLVAVGAFNTNGYPDIVVADTGVGQVTIFQNNSQGYFFPEGQANTGTNPTAMVTGDFNGDGYLDLAIANGGSDNVTILLGKGNETLTPGPQSPATVHSPTSIAVGDFNGDGIADLAVANSSANTITVLLGKGDGTFTAEPDLDTGTTPVSLATGPFTSGGGSDIAVANEDSTSTTGSTATILLSQLTQTATATATHIAPSGAGAHLVEASFPADDDFAASVSSTTSLTGTATQTAATPIFSPAVGTYTSAQSVVITDSTTGATIYYTTNGTTPTTASTKYTAAIAVSTTETIKALAVLTGYTNSAVASATYTIVPPTVPATPVLSPAAGTYSSPQSVTITDATAGATIHYTTNGAVPVSGSPVYTGPITVATNETINAIAINSAGTKSPVATAPYVIAKPVTPIFTPAAGTYSAPQSVKITEATAGTTIHYTTNGAVPVSGSPVYTGPITVATNETINAIAINSAGTKSPVATAPFVIAKPVTPIFTPAAGTYSAPQSVKITEATAGTPIHYTTNGAVPVSGSPVYTGPITVAANETINAIAINSAGTKSPVATAAYSIK